MDKQTRNNLISRHVDLIAKVQILHDEVYKYSQGYNEALSGRVTDDAAQVLVHLGSATSYLMHARYSLGKAKNLI